MLTAQKPIMLTVREAAGLLRISPNLAYELVAQGRMPHVYAQCAGMGSFSGAWAQRRLPEVKWWWRTLARPSLAPNG